MTNRQLPDYKVRPATQDDLSSMLNVEQCAFPEHRWASEDTLKLRMDLFPNGNLVALAKNEVAGFCNGFPIGDLRTQEQLDPIDIKLFMQSGKNWLIRNVAVLPKLQGIGIGEKLVLAQIECAKTNNAQYIRLTATPDLDNFYSRLGFMKIREAEVFHGIKQALWEMQINF